MRATCRKGHPMTPDNVYVRHDGMGVCRTCTLASQRALRARQKALRTGAVTTSDARSVPSEKFWNRVEKVDSGCWEWLGGRSPEGYGRCYVPARCTSTSAHRVAWALSGRELDPTRELDHLCRNRGCVNPDHLELVTSFVNWLRGESPTLILALRTHCKNGHEYTAENTRIEKNGSRGCRACGRAKYHRLRRRALEAS